MKKNYEIELKNFFREQGHEIDENFDLFESGVIDSMIIVQLLSFIEEKFNITPKSNLLSYDNFRNLKAIVNMIEISHEVQ